MRLYNICNLTGLLDTLDTCIGAVSVGTPDGKIYQWGATDSTVLRSILGTMDRVSSQGITLSFENQADMTRILIWAMEDACWPAVAESA